MDRVAKDTDGASCSEGGLLSRMAFNDNKAGMEGIDTDKINKIILETSKGSRFYENERKKEQQVNLKIERMMQQKTQITEHQLRKAQMQVERLTAELERGREMGRTIVHVDMDAFYAAVEMRDRPELKDKPMAVGVTGMLATSNYHARKFGVRSAMPGFIAKKLCPNLIIVHPNFDKYKAMSAEVREIFTEYDPNFLPMSLDEAYLDITEHLEQRQSWPESMRTYYTRTENSSEAETDRLNGNSSPVLFEDSPPGPRISGTPVVFGLSAEEAVREMRFRIEQKTSLTASAGIAPNTMLAKVCSDKNKPNGQYRIPSDREVVMNFIRDLPIRKVPGIGKVTEKMLRALDITTCSELCQKMALLSLLFSEIAWHQFMQISLGLGTTRIESDGERKSMSTERTFSEMSNPKDQYSLCHELCCDLAEDLRKEGLKGKTVTLKLKNVNFEVKTRAFTPSSIVSTEEEIFAVARVLLKTEIDNASPHPLRLRLMGVRVSGFVPQVDKKPLQKSIISFFQVGRQETSASTQVVKDDPRASQPQEEVISSFFGKKSDAQQQCEPQQSFFERARAQRLKMQAMQEVSQEPTSCKDTEQEGNEQSMSRESIGSMEQHFTCPVCFQKQKTNNLEAFNRHIDECLSAASILEYSNRNLDTEDFIFDDDSNCSDRSSSNRTPSKSGGFLVWAQTEDDETARCGTTQNLLTKLDSCVLALEKSDPSIAGATRNLNGADLKASSSYSGPSDVTRGSSSFGTASSSEEPAPALPDLLPCVDNGRKCEVAQAMVGESAFSSSAVGVHVDTALICPVCNMRQKTTDLALFNRHVDVCLNQDVLQELGEATASSRNSDFTSNMKTSAGKLEENQKVPVSRNKHKRQNSPSRHPPSKKSKPICSRNTIDRFFR
nr:PREDICTED: DNA polymerase kappa isoform X1 [Lepisosteus oculatus]XP_015220237.1 PREDICTED: DNA polymerase kappa isoform X1 [Lepisosteus oculatus]